jgi:two-component system chemotaxis response regulator CheY
MTAVRPTSLSILVVEDDPQLRHCIQMLLKRMPYVVAVAADADTAIQLLQDCSFDVVLTDMLIGERGGAEVIAAARMTQPNARIVAMSGGSTLFRPSYCLTQAISWGAAEPLMKPFSFDQLIAAIENHPVAA